MSRARPSRGDIWFAAVMLAVSQVEVWVFGVDGGGLPGAIVHGAMAACLAWWRVAPLATGLGCMGLMFVSAAFGDPGVAPTAIVAAWVPYFSIGRMDDRRRAWIGLAIAVVATIPMVQPPIDPTDWIPIYLAILLTSYVVPWTIGLLVRRRGELLAARAASHQAATEAVEAERARLAREIHDVVSHSISMMVVQAAAADVVLDDNPDRTRAALHDIEAAGRSALSEMRHLLHLLSPEDGVTTVTTPTIADIDTLVDRVRASGLAVEVHREGAESPVSPDVALTAYRLVQEGLTNVLKHAGPCTATVTLDFGDDLTVSVVDDGRGVRERGRGFGLNGMERRVREVGGALSAGPGPAGGFALTASLPLLEAHA